MKCNSGNVTKNYNPTPIGNGELSMIVDMEGSQRQKRYHADGLNGMMPEIWWAARRYNTHSGELIPFGFFTQDTDEPQKWEHELDVKTGSVITDCEYEDGEKIHTEAFVHLNHSMLAIRKTFSGESFTFRYRLAHYDNTNELPDRMSCIVSQRSNGIDINYKIAGLKDYGGIISLWCDSEDAEVSINNNEFGITVTGGSATFYLAFMDSLDHDDFAETCVQLKSLVNQEGFDGMFDSHKKAWAKYWDESYVELADEKAQEVYYTSQYHLRISSTRCSIPTGIFDSHWQGRYFHFDDYFSFMGLITSGHFPTAKKIPHFRFNVLESAKRRAHSYFGKNESGARFSWEQLEDGSEAAPGGFWIEHIFGQANIALTAWYYYLFSGDIDYLRKEGYPLISNCAKFYECQHIYRVGDDRYIVGKCTDLERLGAGRENAFMTTCGVIATFEKAAQAAKILGLDTEETENWNFLAGKLRESLPRENGRYVPFPGCEDKSIAMFAGSFPYPALPADDNAQMAAIDDFLGNENEFGNMYPIGNSVCSWYAGWKGVAFARLGDINRTLACIKQAAGEANCFSEIFEISNPVAHPWFTTAEGSYINMVNESLLQSTRDEIRIIAQNMQDCAFKLAATGGVMVKASIKDKQVSGLTLCARHDYSGKVVIQNGESMEITLKAGERKKLI